MGAVDCEDPDRREESFIRPFTGPTEGDISGGGIGGRGVEDGILDSPRARGVKDMTSHHRGRCAYG